MFAADVWSYVNLPFPENTTVDPTNVIVKFTSSPKKSCTVYLDSTTLGAESETRVRGFMAKI